MEKLTIEQYIKVCEKEDEAFAVMAKDQSAVNDYARIFKKNKYVLVDDSQKARKALVDKKKMVGVVNADNCDLFYTLAKDFGAGAIQFFDTKKGSFVWETVNKENALGLIIKQEDIKKIDAKGYNFSRVCSSAYNE